MYVLHLIEEQTALAAAAAFQYIVRVLSSAKAEDLFSYPVIRDELALGCNSQGVKQTWNNEDIRRGRLIRESVQVTLPDGGERIYASVRVAFISLRLPDQKHVRFRLRLKKQREAKFEWKEKVYVFKLMPFAGRSTL